MKHIDRFKDRHGRMRYYYRAPGCQRIPLPDIGAPDFLDAYAKAAAAAAPKAKPAKNRGEEGTFARLAHDYYVSTDFLALKPSTRAKNRGLIDRFCEEHGHRLVKQMTRQHVTMIVGRKAATPAGANNLLKIVRMLIRFSIANGWRPDDPTSGIKKFAEGTYHTWTEEEIAQFETRWPLGSRERTAFALHLFTGQRRHDVCSMTWRDYEPATGRIDVIQEKTGAKLSIPVHRSLRAALDAWPRTHVMILTTSFGKPFAVAGYGNYMADSIEGAGLPDRCVLHGLRKAAARRMAEAGCSANQIMSITGHSSMDEVERYTRMAAQKRLSSAAVTLVEEHFGAKDSQPQ
ncbi:tyrosine-type recombinase/integrase [Kaistia adipata]|uniref:tyrosine-type recombinase/integrase n=1 Tax=Kaistia adipata TaxID=166954 RepID=UPI00146A2258|nr:tyrosine-type recombinase/integrase [Kaistia adipata]